MKVIATIIVILLSALIGLISFCFRYAIKEMRNYKRQSDNWKQQHSDKLNDIEKNICEIKGDIKLDREKIKNIEKRLK